MKITRKNLIRVKKFQGEMYNKTKKRNNITHAHSIQRQVDEQYNINVRLWVNDIMYDRRRTKYSKIGKKYERNINEKNKYLLTNNIK